MKFFELVYKLAREQGLSIEKLSLKVGKSPRYVGRTKSRGSSPTVANAAMILDALGYSLCLVPDENVPENAIVIDE